MESMSWNLWRVGIVMTSRHVSVSHCATHSLGPAGETAITQLSDDFPTSVLAERDVVGVSCATASAGGYHQHQLRATAKRRAALAYVEEEVTQELSYWTI